MKVEEKLAVLKRQLEDRERSYPYEAAKGRAAGRRLATAIDKLRARIAKLEKKH